MRVLLTYEDLVDWAAATLAAAAINTNAETCLTLLSLTGCRAGETRQERWKYLEDELFELETEKRNYPRIISEEQVPLNFTFCIQQRNMLFCLASYSTIKYWLTKCQPFKVLNTKKDCSTHVFRHIYAKKLHLQGLSILEIQVVLGERHIASVYQYVYSALYRNI